MRRATPRPAAARPRRRISLPALALGALAAGLSLAFLRAEIAALPLTRTAEALEVAKALPRIAPASRAMLEAAGTAGPDCTTRPLRARLSAALFLLDRDVADETPLAERLDRFAAAQGAATALLRCAPLDGGVWARLAALDRLAAFEPTRYGAMMALSARQSPFEGAAMAVRWVSLSQTPDLPARLGEPALRIDLCRFLAGSAPDDALTLLAALDRPQTRGALQDVLRAVPQDRRDAWINRNGRKQTAAPERPAALAELLQAADAAPPRPIEDCGFTESHELTPPPLRPVRFLQASAQAPS
ncbi:hypothetical protein [Aureimonas sp. N4]|uniref:hypothetical protein n=1 Tax=Aureimonas sp. N4 TaxID=1638165 RepID=UPI0007856D0C|nr:hypothetical protein [Aureimonas sp. N4]